MTMVLLLAVSGANAQTLEPRFYSNAPIGLNFVLAGYGLSTGGLSLDPTLNVDNADLTVHTSVLAYARSFGLFGKSAKFDLVLPYAWLEGDAVLDGTPITRKSDGLADPTVRFSYNFYGAPALPMEQFKTEYSQNVVCGASMKITAPLGQYEKDKAVNIGQNRWAFSPEIGASKRIGRMLLEAAATATVYTDNDEFQGATKEQDPLYSLQAHMVYLFRNQWWIALGATRYVGGRTTVGGIQNDDLIQSSRFGGTLAVPITKRHSLKLYGSTGVELRTGSDFDTFGVAWQYRWGGGL